MLNQREEECVMSRNAYHLYGNFGEHFQASGTGVTFFRTENSDGIEIYHLQNKRFWTIGN